MSQRHKRTIAVAAAAATILIVVAGCGGSGSKSSTAKSGAVAASTSSTTTQPSSTSSPTAVQKIKSHKSARVPAPTHTSSNTAPSQPAARTQKSSPAAPAASPASAHHVAVAQTPVGPLQVALSAPNHAPSANVKWPYSVSVRDGQGRPLNGTVDVEFVFAGKVVGRATPPTDPVKDGKWHDLLTYPAASVGIPLTFRLVVHTSIGSKTIDWPVKVHH